MEGGSDSGQGESCGGGGSHMAVGWESGGGGGGVGVRLWWTGSQVAVEGESDDG